MGDAPPKYEFAKLELKPGDILVVKFNGLPLDFTHSVMEGLRKAAAAKLPEGVSCFVVGPRVDLMTITREQAGPLIEGKAPAPVKKPKAAKT